MELINDRYHIGGIDALSLVEKYGDPLFVYDGDKIKKKYEHMFNAFSVPKLQISYACKALTNINILKLMHRLGAHIDAVSIQEIKLALHAGFSPDRIDYTPSGVSEAEIEEVVALGIQLNVDSIALLEYIGHHHPSIGVGIRINPHVMAGGNRKISVGHIDSKFGISIHQLPLVKRIIDNLDISLNGIHMHTGSDILDVEVFMRAVDILFGVAEEFPDIDYIDFGSGFKVPYRHDDIYTDIEQLGKEMSKKFNSFCKKHNKDITLIFEPGKYLVSEAGHFLARTNVVKQTTSTIFAALNTGMNHMIRPMFYNAYHQITNLNNPNGKPRIYSVVGYICETDTFAFDRKIAEIDPGHILCFKNAGAYCFSMASNYNSRLLPPEVLIIDGKDHLIRKRQSFDQLLLNQLEPEF